MGRLQLEEGWHVTHILFGFGSVCLGVVNSCGFV